MVSFSLILMHNTCSEFYALCKTIVLEKLFISCTGGVEVRVGVTTVALLRRVQVGGGGSRETALKNREKRKD